MIHQICRDLCVGENNKEVDPARTCPRYKRETRLWRFFSRRLLTVLVKNDSLGSDSSRQPTPITPITRALHGSELCRMVFAELTHECRLRRFCRDVLPYDLDNLWLWRTLLLTRTRSSQCAVAPKRNLTSVHSRRASDSTPAGTTRWSHLLSSVGLGLASLRSVSRQCRRFTSCTETMAKIMQEQEGDNRIVAKSWPTTMNLAVS